MSSEPIERRVSYVGDRLRGSKCTLCGKEYFRGKYYCGKCGRKSFGKMEDIDLAITGDTAPGGISKQGHRMLRRMLVEVSWLALRYNPHFRAVYERICRGSRSRRKIAIVAVARKLLITAWAMLRDGSRWRPPRHAVASAV